MRQWRDTCLGKQWFSSVADYLVCIYLSSSKSSRLKVTIGTQTSRVHICAAAVYPSVFAVCGVRTTSLPDSIRNRNGNLMLPGKMWTVLHIHPFLLSLLEWANVRKPGSSNLSRDPQQVTLASWKLELNTPDAECC